MLAACERSGVGKNQAAGATTSRSPARGSRRTPPPARCDDRRANLIDGAHHRWEYRREFGIEGVHVLLDAHSRLGSFPLRWWATKCELYKAWILVAAN